MEKNGEFIPEKETEPQKKHQEVVKTGEVKLEQVTEIGISVGNVRDVKKVKMD